VPDESTIRKITRRCGPELIEALNRELLTAAHQRGDVDLSRCGRTRRWSKPTSSIRPTRAC
jgi:hypothetical protein